MVWFLRIWMLLNCFVCWQLGLVVEFYSMIIVYEFMFSIPICVIRSGSCSCFLLTVPCFHSICFNDEHVKFNCLDIVIGWISWYEYRGTHVSYTTCYNACWFIFLLDLHVWLNCLYIEWCTCTYVSLVIYIFYDQTIC